MKESALKISKGVEQVSSLNPNLKTNVSKNKKNVLKVDEYVQGILKQDLLMLSKGITLVESNNHEHHLIASEIIEKLLPYTGNSIRIGITGVPGVGKSTFIEAFGEYIISKNKKLAVLAIDPTSQRSHGSILGDKTRMENLSKNPHAYIRPSPAGGSLGGVARKTRETTLLCEAAGFDTILIETVGVGQSETAVHSMVDFFLLLMLAGAGDELQGIKRGIMEMADMIAINKADGDNFHKATGAKSEYSAALHLFPPTASNWIPKVLTCSSTEATGIDQVWNHIEEYIQLTKENGYYTRNRKEQTRYWFREFLTEAIQDNFYAKPNRKEKAKSLEDRVVKGEITSLTAIRELMES
ncbi:methylmalonyl Co-A mutase-associated GTPase MeaB [Leptospira sp. GIMC2001]|uniref:methylmalonyl Co-A mutase-associated GTPase MeaB n=1 Tax=Leptospira sp. GIMC2001 TaxID=1513297 RepID=UPI00234AD22A|nr:methylmalonyl Co-A mutase-associated GTPase MeaB [Leptospira sp. GIMC2001]WCL47793.1 methylmalonyl Co-A mutase-associated GTPase MeaB [Leptospira sp. GIMC2001]